MYGHPNPVFYETNDPVGYPDPSFSCRSSIRIILARIVLHLLNLKLNFMKWTELARHSNMSKTVCVWLMIPTGVG
jgi:hypothetical protein